MALRDQPYLPLYIQDFLTDEKLIECSASSTGVYIRLLCIMHKSKEYGTILLQQKDKQTSNQINNFAIKLQKHLPFSAPIIVDALDELINEGCLQLNGDKLLQKRMIRDNEISIIRKEAGSKGGFAKAKRLAKELPNSEYEYEYENENEIVIKNEIKKNATPDFQEFLSYCKTLSIYHSSFDFQIEAKYNAWVENKWKDGHNKPIKNWKTKVQNTMPYFKKDNNNGRATNQQRRKDYVTEDEYKSGLKKLYEG